MKANIISRVMEAFIMVLGVYAFYKHDLLWGFACIIGFFLSMLPVILKRSFKFSTPWIIEFLVVVAISLHIWGGLLGLYKIPFYDKFAHFLASAIIAFFALIVIYALDTFSTRIHMDFIALSFFTIIFTIAIGAMWEIAEFASDQIFSHGIPVAQVSLNDTMTDLIADSIAGICIGIGGSIGIRRGELKEMIFEIGGEIKKFNKFFERKNAAMKKLSTAILHKRVDKKALPVIERINKMSDFFTTSSCSGRIVILEIPEAGSKRRAKFLGKWHGEINMEKMEKAILKAREGEIWFLVQSPIFHVFTISLRNAKTLLHTAMQSGFKYSSIKSINGKIMVEILSTEKMDVPIGRDGKMYVSRDYIKMLIEIANKLMKRMDMKLKRFERRLKEMENILIKG